LPGGEKAGDDAACPSDGGAALAAPARRGRGVAHHLARDAALGDSQGLADAHLIAWNAAKREAFEEAGIAGRVRRRAVGRYTYDKRAGDGSRQGCLVTVYALQVVLEHRAWPERRERTRGWFDAGAAARMVREPQSRALIRAFAGG
jgi:8-oxo-dGTP pyrophosphatase MutT (NUDIX family)